MQQRATGALTLSPAPGEEEHYGQVGSETNAEAEEPERPSAMAPDKSEHGYQYIPASKDSDEDDWESAVDPQSGAQYFYSHKKKIPYVP